MLKAVIYDFDGTLTPESTAQFQILEKSGFKNGMDDPRFFVAVKTMMKEKKSACMKRQFGCFLIP